MAELRLIAISHQTGREERGKHLMHIIEKNSTRNHPCGTISVSSAKREDHQIAEAVFYMTRLVNAKRSGDIRGDLEPFVDHLKELANKIDSSLEFMSYDDWCKADRIELDEQKEYLESEMDERGYHEKLKLFGRV